jgi:hypothetical protein
MFAKRKNGAKSHRFDVGYQTWHKTPEGASPSTYESKRRQRDD